MKILIDMQGTQTESSKDRGIGRYTRDFIKAFLKIAKGDIYLLFNATLSKKYIDEFKDYNIIEFFVKNNNDKDLIREKFIADINPDVVLVTSLFESVGESAAVSIKKFYDIPTAVIFYDLIPFIHKHHFFKDKEFKKWYLDRLSSLKKADLLLSISEYAKKEALEYLGDKNVVTISSNVEIKNEFSPLDRFNIKKEYFLHVSACDKRKNFEGLIEAFGVLDEEIKSKYQLVLVCNASNAKKQKLLNIAKKYNIDDLIITGYVEDKELYSLYKNAKLFIFPSFHEGFGLPILEAMKFGVVAIGSNISSIPEVIGNKEALFNPYDKYDIAKCIKNALKKYDKFQKIAAQQIKKFSWEKSAKIAFDAIQKIAKKNQEFGIFENSKKLLEMVDKENLEVIEKNEKIALKILQLNKIQIEGPFDSSYSLALLNRETARALEKIGVDVALHSTEGYGDFEPNRDFLDKNPDIKNMYLKKITPNITSRNLYPPRVDGMDSKINMFHHYAWEESGFVDEWVENFNKHLTGISTLSHHVTKILIDNGLSIPVFRSGCGVEHWDNIKSKTYHLETEKNFKFLHVSSCFPRKGVDVLLKAYQKAFRKYNDVVLIIKTFENPHNNIESLINEMKQNDEDLAEIIVINQDLEDSKLKSIYEQCDVLVAPSRAEGFGLPIAEAMLSGLGVITTKWGGQLDFCNDKNSWLLDFRFEKAKTHFDIFNSLWAEPDEKHLVELLQLAYNTPKQKIRQKSEYAKKTLENFTWVNAAKNMIDSAKKFKSFKKNQKIGWVSTWEMRCGIATYSKHLLSYFENQVTIFSTKRSGSGIKCWETSDVDTNLDELFLNVVNENIEVLVIQFNYSFFGFEEFNQFLDKLDKKGIKIVITLHSTFDDIGANKKLEYITNLKKCKRILVHSIKDMNRLKNIGLVTNTTLFPHGVLEYDTKISDKNVIATYGFALPHKGLLEVIEACEMLDNITLKMVNAQHPADVSEKIVSQIKEKIKNKNIEFISDFLSDEECFRELADAKLVIFPYQKNGESASGAVRYALALNKQIAISESSIFDDIRELGWHIDTNPKQMAKDIKNILDKIDNNSQEYLEKKEKITKWREYHKYSHLAKKLENIIEMV